MSNENEEQKVLHDLKMQKIKEEVLKKFSEYRTLIQYMATDAPIEILCLPKPIEKILLSNRLFRVYDLFNVDFVEIKGLGEARIRQLTTCLDQFFSML
jgi:hypothetical protein